MKFLYVILAVAVFVVVRVSVYRIRRSRRTREEAVSEGPEHPGRADKPLPRMRTARRAIDDSLGDVGMVAAREIRERIRGRIFRIGTLIILVAVAAAIVIPTLQSSAGPTRQKVGVVGVLSPESADLVYTAGSRNQDSVKLVTESSLNVAHADLRSGKIDFAIVDGNEIVLNEPASSKSSPADPSLVQAVAEYLGVLKAYRTARLTPSQAAQVTHAKAVPVQTLSGASKSSTKTTSVVGVVLLFIMLTQYNTWILIGVMQEKASRVVEVLLATVRPIQLLGGKVLGIGLVALGQATLIVGFALIVGTAVGSDLLHGTGPLVLACQLLWLVLGYAFYCWVYAAAGSTAERQDQVQTLALPLSIPILLGYIFAITVASSGNADLFFKILAYVPFTAPFCMPVLVALSQVTWWEFVASVLITVAGTAAMAGFAAQIYRRAVLRTGGRVRVRELFARAGS
ncbi:MAG: ABC transporter permease [Acidimicrobiales bacterium]